MDGKKLSGFGLNDIVVSTLDDEEAQAPSFAKKQPEQKAVVAPKPAPAAAPKPAPAPVAPPKPSAAEQTIKEAAVPSNPKLKTSSSVLDTLVEPATTTVEAGGLRIEVSHLEDLD